MTATEVAPPVPTHGAPIAVGATAVFVVSGGVAILAGAFAAAARTGLRRGAAV